jgi:hypothetical protein
MDIKTLRKKYHERICTDIIRISENQKGPFPNFADGSSHNSILIANGIVKLLEYQTNTSILSGNLQVETLNKLPNNFLKSF